MYDGDMTNSAAQPGTVQWYADRHSAACKLVQDIHHGLNLLEIGEGDYDLMYDALTAANESARALYNIFCIAAEREMDASEVANADQAASDHAKLRSQ